MGVRASTPPRVLSARFPQNCCRKYACTTPSAPLLAIAEQVHDVMTTYVNVSLLKIKLFAIQTKSAKLRSIGNELWCVTDSGEIVKSAADQDGKWQRKHDHIRFVLHTNDVRITYVISDCVSTVSGNIVVSCSGFESDKPITDGQEVTSLALVEIDHSGSILWVIDNDQYFTQLTSLEDSVFALMPQANQSPKIKWFRHDGHEWESVIEIFTQDAIVTSSLGAYCNHLYVTCSNTSAVYVINLGAYSTADLDTVDIIITAKDRLFAMQHRHVRIHHVTKNGDIFMTAASAKPEDHVTITRDKEDEQCVFYTLHGDAFTSVAMTQAGDIIVTTKSERDVMKLSRIS